MTEGRPGTKTDRLILAVARANDLRRHACFAQGFRVCMAHPLLFRWHHIGIERKRACIERSEFEEAEDPGGRGDGAAVERDGGQRRL